MNIKLKDLLDILNTTHFEISIDDRVDNELKEKIEGGIASAYQLIRHSLNSFLKEQVDLLDKASDKECWCWVDEVISDINEILIKENKQNDNNK